MKSFLIIALTGIALFATSRARLRAEEAEIKVNLKHTPAAVQATVAQQLGDGKLVSIHKENEDGAWQYSVDYKKDGRAIEMAVSLDGKLISSEWDIPVTDAPRPVQKAFKSYAKGGTITESEQVTMADGSIFFEADFPGQGSTEEVQFSPKGKIMKVETE